MPTIATVATVWNAIVDKFAENGAKMAGIAAPSFTPTREPKKKNISLRKNALISEQLDPNCALSSGRYSKGKLKSINRNGATSLVIQRLLQMGFAAGCELTIDTVLILDSGLGVLEAARASSVLTTAALESEGTASFATNAGEAVFWSGKTSGVGGADVARSIAASQGGTTLEQLARGRGIELPVWDAGNPASVQAWQDASRAFAENANGTVTAVIGDSLRPGSVWETIELPALEANRNVTQIIRIDPATGV